MFRNSFILKSIQKYKKCLSYFCEPPKFSTSPKGRDEGTLFLEITLDRWTCVHAKTGRIFTAEKVNGAAPLLDDEQYEIAASCVLSHSENRIRLNYS